MGKQKVLARPFIELIGYAKSLKESRKLAEFYLQPFREEELEKIFRLILCGEDIKSWGTIFSHDAIVTLNYEKRTFTILNGRHFDDFWFYEYRMPYPRTVGEFIGHCNRCGFELAFTEEYRERGVTE